MQSKHLTVSALALFGLFSLLSSLRALAPEDAAETHSLNGCDPGVPPVVLSDMTAVPVNFYSETTTTESNEDYVVSFLPPKPMAVELIDPKESVRVPFGVRTLHEVTFRYDITAKTMTLIFDPDTTNPGDETEVKDIPYTGTYKATAKALPIGLLGVPHAADNKKRVRFFVQYRGLFTSFDLSDQ